MTNYLVNIFIASLKVGRPLLKGRLQIKYSFFLTLSGIWVGHWINVGFASTRFGCTVGISIVVIRPMVKLRRDLGLKSHPMISMGKASRQGTRGLNHLSY